MATSLEQLLAEEGFRGRKSAMRSRASYRAEAASLPLHNFPEEGKGSSSSAVHKFKTERARSDVHQYALRGESPSSSGSSSRRPRDNLVKKDGNQKGNLEVEGSTHVRKKGARQRIDIHMEEEEEEIRVKEIYSVKAYSSERSAERSSKGNRVNEMHRETKGKDINVDKRHGGSSTKNLLKHAESGDDKRKSMKQGEKSYESSIRGLRNHKTLGDNERGKRESLPLPEISELALDKVAVKAMISILTSYSKRFLNDGEYRIALRRCCFASLNFSEIEGDENKVRTNLEEAIDTVEKAAEEAATEKDVKKASLQLSVIAGLNSDDQKDGYACGTRNSILSACAHFYLGMIYKVQKKDIASARHTLQSFCDSPFFARTLLLPELWDNLFFPHLSHLEAWYNQEADSLLNTPSRKMRHRLLDKVYNEILDSGTHQFAAYYKDWLTKGLEAPSIPCIPIPSMSVEEFPHEESQDHSFRQGTPPCSFSPQPMVSKKLYDAVFCRSSKPGVYEAEDGGKMANFDNGMSSSDGSAVEIKQALPLSSEKIKDLDQERGKHSSNGTSVPELGNAEEWKLVNAVPDSAHKYENSSGWEEIVGDHELTLKSLAKSVFEMQQSKVSSNETVSALSHSTRPRKVNDSYEELSYEYFDEGSIFSSIPQDFICPLTGQLFEEPVTLETGQTFEGEAIKEWFNQGHTTCPVTGKSLESLTAPLTNLILKRVIGGWKLEHCSRLLAFASEIFRNSGGYELRQAIGKGLVILEKLLATFSKEENLRNARHIISLGGLEFLTKSFEFGNLDEKARVAALLCCCIEAENGCRNKISSDINKKCLFELLHSTQIPARENAVSLMIELVSPGRRNHVTTFFTSLQHDEIMNTMQILLMHLQSCQPEQRPLVAVLLLRLDLLVETQKSSLYRQEAADEISVALERSLIDRKVQENACRALLHLGGRFSASGKLLTESWILKQAGYNIKSKEEEEEEEEEGSEEWLRNMSASLVGNGEILFLKSISKCLSCGKLELVRACLITISWLSRAICSVPGNEYQLSALSDLLYRLRESLEHGEQIENKILASMSLLNFSKIPECRVLLMEDREGIAGPLQSLAEVTWTAKHLYATIWGEDI